MLPNRVCKTNILPSQRQEATKWSTKQKDRTQIWNEDILGVTTLLFLQLPKGQKAKKKQKKKPIKQTKTSSTNLNNKCHFMPHSIPSACSSSTKISFLVLWERQSRQREYSFLLWAYTLFSSATQWAELWLELCLLGYLKIYMHVFLLQFTYIYTIQHMGRQVVQ